MMIHLTDLEIEAQEGTGPKTHIKLKIQKQRKGGQVWEHTGIQRQADDHWENKHGPGHLKMEASAGFCLRCDVAAGG